ncbi:hypothetical protein P4T04_03125 [Bacillus badius]|uniref:hypothetical protein n=1 Tax=Bacillus badius TaxID=1455 RepID=UPI002E20F423|nr:hypothetical protein [Bacillus badius]
MAEITTAAYTALRNYVQSNWKYIELQDETGAKIVRLTTTDNRVTFAIEGNNVKFTVIIKGSDADIIKPKTFTKGAIYDVPTGGTPYSIETFDNPFIMTQDQDELTVTLTIKVPQVM